jgi:hypothetical protein
MGHLEICSSQVGDPEDCPVCKTRPPKMPRASHKDRPMTTPSPEGERIVEQAQAIVGRAMLDLGRKMVDEEVALNAVLAALSSEREALVGEARKASAWLRECSGWLLETDLDMTCPMQTDPLDIADDLDAALAKVEASNVE